MKYELYYWPGIQGRGEFVRLALEQADAAYVDVARGKNGEAKLMRVLEDKAIAQPGYAPPLLKAGSLHLAQTANILFFLGARHGLAPKTESGRLWTNQLQLTIADLVEEVHGTHHPIASSLYYEDQKDEAKRAATAFVRERIPKYLGYFERVLARNRGRQGVLVGSRLTYADLSLFQVVDGLRYAFPHAMRRAEKETPRVVALHDVVRRQPKIAAYLASTRRMPRSENGLFRRYPELDA
jgi:glutathione S-transferase